MTQPLVVIWAQSLDNRRDDVECDGVAVTDADQRRSLLDAMAATNAGGIVLRSLGPGTSAGTVAGAVRTSNEVVLRLNTPDRDAAGRTSPINVWFRAAGVSDAPGRRAVTDAVLGFLERTGRQPVPRHRLLAAVLAAGYGGAEGKVQSALAHIRALCQAIASRTRSLRVRLEAFVASYNKRGRS